MSSIPEPVFQFSSDQLSDYFWLSDHEVLLFRVGEQGEELKHYLEYQTAQNKAGNRNPRREGYAIERPEELRPAFEFLLGDIRDNSVVPMTGVNSQCEKHMRTGGAFVTISGNPEVSFSSSAPWNMAVSPDGEWIAWHHWCLVAASLDGKKVHVTSFKEERSAVSEIQPCCHITSRGSCVWTSPKRWSVLYRGKSHQYEYAITRDINEPSFKRISIFEDPPLRDGLLIGSDGEGRIYLYHPDHAAQGSMLNKFGKVELSRVSLNGEIPEIEQFIHTLPEEAVHVKASISPDGKHIGWVMFPTPTGDPIDLWISDTEGTGFHKVTRTRRGENSRSPWPLQWTTCGRYLTWSSGGAIWRVDTRSESMMTNLRQKD